MVEVKINKKGRVIKAELKNGLGAVRGLMFSRKKNIVLVSPFERILSIHMLFVFFPIKAVWLDSRKRVVDVKTARPFQMRAAPAKKAKYVLETPDISLKFRIGEKLKFI